MNKNEFIEIVRIIFDREFRDQIKRDASLKDVCRALKTKKRELKELLKETSDEQTRKKILDQIEIVRAQHNKALILRKKKSAQGKVMHQ